MIEGNSWNILYRKSGLQWQMFSWNLSGKVTKRKEDKRYITEAIYNFMHDAKAYIEYLQDWEKLDPSEKTYYKNIQAKKAVKAYMAKEKPTNKQLSYLKFLGYTGPAPESKADASELIATIKVFNKIEEKGKEKCSQCEKFVSKVNYLGLCDKCKNHCWRCGNKLDWKENSMCSYCYHMMEQEKFKEAY